MTTPPAQPEFRQVSLQWEQPLAAFFAELAAGGDEHYFHPHPLTAAHAAVIAHHEGKDFYCIATRQRQVLAYGMLRGWDEGYEVPSLGIVVHPSARAQGLGRAFMLYLHDAARQRGAGRIRLKVYPGNAAAVRLYESLGYVFQAEEAGQRVGIVELR